MEAARRPLLHRLVDCTLGMLEQRIGNRELLLRDVRHDLRAIEREGMAWMQPFATVLRAGISLRTGQRELAVESLEAAARDFDAHHMTAYGAAVRERAIRLRGSSSAHSECARVAEVFRAEAVVAPDKLIAMLAPGLLAWPAA
jgi:hypothetical protein